MESRYEQWLSLFRGVVQEQRELLASMPTQKDRAAVAGRGASGDTTLLIDENLERILLDALENAPHAVTVLTEEAGSVGTGEATLLIDPLDGSFNAQSLFPAYAFSAALAEGPRLGDVQFAYVFDLATGDEFIAQQGLGAWCNGSRIIARDASRPQVVAFESVEYDPHQLAAVIEKLARQLGAFRTRILGSTALALCYAALGRVEAVVSSGQCRVIDFAGAQLVAREAGLEVDCHGESLDEIAFGLERVHRVNAAPSETALRLITLVLDEVVQEKD